MCDEWTVAECMPFSYLNRLYVYRTSVGVITPDSNRLTEVGNVVPRPKLACEYLTSPDAFRRWQLSELLNGNGLTRTAVEIGTHRGIFASNFLRSWRGRQLICVDPWDEGLTDCDTNGKPLLPPGHGETRNDDYLAALETLAPYKNHYSIWKVTSSVAWKKISPSTIDFIYLDGSHRREIFEQDIVSAWRSLRAGGILAGHDYNGEWEHDIRPALEEFCESVCVKCCHLIPGDAMSWYFTKDE